MIIQDSSKQNSVLHQSAQPVKKITPEIKQLIEQMIVEMKRAQGVGLAAPQIGSSLQIFVIDEEAFWEKPSPLDPASTNENNDLRLGGADRERQLKVQERPNFKFLKAARKIKDALAFINPELSYLSLTTTQKEEGCLSLMEPQEIRAIVKRAKKAIVKATDLNGKSFKIQGKRLLARAFQHEMDHLKGKLITDVAIKSWVVTQ